MDALGFADKIALQNGHVIFRHNGVLKNGAAFYLYIAVKGNNLLAYKALLEKTPPTMEDFKKIGKIVAFGEGEPSSELKERLSAEYGVQE